MAIENTSDEELLRKIDTFASRMPHIQELIKRFLKTKGENKELWKDVIGPEHLEEPTNEV